MTAPQPSAATAPPGVAARAAIGAVGLYRRWLAPTMGGRCRFSPSCSVYAQDALARHGVMRGSWLTLRRLCRCHPWGGCGHDPVP